MFLEKLYERFDDILGVCWFLIELCVFVRSMDLAGS